MPRTSRRYRTNSRRRLTGTQLARIKRVRRPASLVNYAAGARLAGHSIPAFEAAHMAYEAARHATNIYNKTMSAFDKSKHKGIKQLRQTKSIQRGNKLKTTANRHEKLKMAKGTKMNKGKGFNKSSLGVIITHPNSRIPKWKKDRIYKYKYDVWQTVLLSKSNRLPASNNTLQTSRYPIKAPEALDSERTQTMLFTPFCSNYTGVLTTYYRHVRADGNDLAHDTTNRLDVIQNKANIDRFRKNNNMIEANDGDDIKYAGNASASDVAAAANQTAILRSIDQLVKEVHLDLVFMSSRAFPIKISVSVVRAIKPQSPLLLTTDNKRELCNGISNHGCDWNTWKTEYHHEFTLPALRVNKKPPTYSVNKILKTNFLQTNSFNENTTAQDMEEAAKTSLGLNIHSHTDEIADGFMSGNFYILIKYRKVQQPQQFTYTQTIEADSDSTSSRFPSATVSLPVVTEESFDVPTHDGITGADSSGDQFETGKPLSSATTAREDLASFYLNGKLKYKWGFRNECESIPSILTDNDASSDYKKPLSLNIDPTYDMTVSDFGSRTTYGVYQSSPDQVKIAKDTSV